ncbi:hypothetical protein ACQQ9T_08005, partial [Limosilactobacillus reuteri]
MYQNYTIGQTEFIRKQSITVRIEKNRVMSYRKVDVYPQSWKSTLGVFYMTKISVKTKLKAIEEYA